MKRWRDAGKLEGLVLEHASQDHEAAE
jgi:hypothetical protein